MQELTVKTRTELGKKVKVMRKSGFMPAILYGPGILPMPLSVPYKDFEKIWHEAGESTLIKLKLEDGKINKQNEFTVLIQDMKKDPIKGSPLHADFYAVRMDKEIRKNVPIEFVGESPAVKNLGGILVKVLKELEVEALPQNLPHDFKVDVSQLVAINDRLLVKNISIPSGVKIFINLDEVVALIEPPRSEEELAQLEKVEEAAPVEVKTEREIKVETKKGEEAEAEAASAEVKPESTK